MSVLGDYVTARVPADRMKNISNATDKTATTVNVAQVERCVLDAVAEFQTTVGVAFDPTSARHVSTCAAGVLYYLYLWRGIVNDPDAAMVSGLWKNLLKAFMRNGGTADWHPPFTNTTATPSADADTLPWSDPVNMADLTPNQPGGSGTTPPNYKF